MVDDPFSADLPVQDMRDIQFDLSSNMLLAQAVTANIDIGSKIKSYGRWGLYATKTEIVLYDLRQCLYWQSLLELGLIGISFILMLIFGRFLIFMQLLHFPRPLFAFRVMENLPKSHIIYEELPEQLDDVSTYQPLIFAHFKKGSKAISVYLIITIISGLLDLISLTIQFSSIDSNHNPDVLYAIIVWIFLCLDCFCIFWYYTLKYTYPEEVWHNLRKLAKGSWEDARFFFKSTFQRLQENISRARTSLRR